MGFIERYFENLDAVKGDELYSLYSSLFTPEGKRSVIYFDAMGRSLTSTLVGIRPLGRDVGRFSFYHPESDAPPDPDLSRGLEMLENHYDVSNYFGISSSGESKIPKKNFEIISDSKKAGKIEKTGIHLLTSNPGSSIGKIVSGIGGNVIEMKGRAEESKKMKNRDYIRNTSLLETVFEDQIIEFGDIISTALVSRIEPDKFPEYFKRGIKNLLEIRDWIDSVHETEAYQNLIEKLEDPFVKVFACGQSSSNNLVKNNNIRLQQIRPLSSDLLDIKEVIEMLSSGKHVSTEKNYVIGESATPPYDRDSMLIAVSRSGKSAKVRDAIENAKKAGAEVFFVTKDGFDESSNMILIEGNNSYMKTECLLTDVNMRFAYDVVKRGGEVSEDTLGKRHVRDKTSEDHYSSR